MQSLQRNMNAFIKQWMWFAKGVHRQKENYFVLKFNPVRMWKVIEKKWEYTMSCRRSEGKWIYYLLFYNSCKKWVWKKYYEVLKC